MTRVRTGIRAIALATGLLLIAFPAWSIERDDQAGEEEEEEEAEFDEAFIFFELNDTDGDLGIHALIDGDAWKKLRIKGPNGRKLLDVRVRSRLKAQGLTEFFFESAEPTFDELAPEAFFARFPEGVYEVQGLTLDHVLLESESEITHVMPAPPGNVTVNGVVATAEEGEECEEEELPLVGNPIVVEWDAVTESHPDLGAFSDDLEVIRYTAVAEFEDEDENVFVTSVDLQPDEEIDRYRVTIPEEFARDGVEGKFEILVREASYNQTAVETCPFEFVAD